MPDFEPPVDGPATYQPEPYDPTAQLGADGTPLGGAGQPWTAPGSAYQWSPQSYGMEQPARRGRRIGWVVAGVVVIVAVGFLGYHLSSSSSGGGPTAAASTVPGTTSPTNVGGLVGNAPEADSPAALGAILESAAVQQSDLTNGYRVRLMPGGDQVLGQVTLDNCGHRFSTEAHRVARRQYEVLDGRARNTGLSNELVAYDSVAQAAKALRQWHVAAAHCPTHPVRSTVAGTPRMREQTLRNELDIAALPITSNARTVEAFTLPGGRRAYGIAILQVRGRFLDAIYITQRRIPTGQDMTTMTLLATVTGDRLIAAT